MPLNIKPSAVSSPQNVGVFQEDLYDTLDIDQKNAVDGLYSWYYGNTKKSLHTSLSGVAGSGKSYIIKILSDKLLLKKKNLRIAYGTLTAKAALVLKSRGIETAQTIHSLIYDCHITKDKHGNAVVSFIKRKHIFFDLIIIDEASMVSFNIFQDLCQYNIPIICIGDSFQLPPIEGSFNLMDKSLVDFNLTTIYRQEKDNEIIKLSERLRNGENIPFHNAKDTRKIMARDLKDDDILNHNQILTGKNKSRVGINQRFRQLSGFTHRYPERNERLIFIKNAYKFGVLNGQQIVLTDIPIAMGKKHINMKFYDLTYDISSLLNLKEQSVKASVECLDSLEPSNIIMNNKTDCVFVDYAYCISTHKAQGSQWDKVLIMDDLFGVWDRDLRQRWLYTAVTRASERLTICVM